MAVETLTKPAEHGHAQRPDAIPIANAAVLHLKGDLRGALEILVSASSELETADLLKSRGYLQIELKDFSSAATSYEGATNKQSGSVENWFQWGFCLQKLGRAQEALEKFEKAASLGGDWIEIPLARAICHLSLKQYAHAIGQAEQCLVKEALHIPALFTKGVALQLTWELDKAMDVYRHILEQDPKNVQVLTNLITAGLQKKDYKAVQADSATLLAIDPDHTLALEGAATAAFSRAEFESAGRWYQRLTQLAPNQAEHWLNLGITLRKLNRVSDAIEPFARARRIRPDSVHACTHLGDALWKAGDLSGARSCYEESIAKWPEREDFTLSLSHLLEQLEIMDLAERVCDDYCRRSADKPQVWFRLGYVQWKRNRIPESVKSFSRAVELEPVWPEAEVNLALVCFTAGDIDRAESILNGLAERVPDHIDALKGLATIAVARRQDERGLELHKKLIALGQCTPDIYFNAGVLCQNMNRLDEAVGFYRKAIELRSDFAEALLNLGHALKDSGDPEEAKAFWIPALELHPDFALDYFQRR